MSIGKWLEQRRKWADDLLTKVLGFPKVQDDIEDLKKDDEWNKEFGWTQYNFEREAIEHFFEGDVEETLNVAEIWKAVKTAIEGKIEDITFDAKTLVHEGYGVKIETIIDDKLSEIQEDLEDALDRKHKKGKYAKPTST